MSPVRELPRRHPVLLMLGMLALVLASGGLLHRLALKGVIDLPGLLGTRNHGQLIVPARALAELALHGERSGAAWQQRGWGVLLIIDQDCLRECRRRLHETRQVRTALGQDGRRLQRLLLVSGEGVSPELRSWLAHQHADVELLHGSPGEVAALQVDLDGVREGELFIVDPAGWLMMAYSAEQAARDLLDDLKFLLRNSRERPGGSGSRRT